MSRPLLVLSSLGVLLAACSSTSSGLADPSLEKEAIERQRLANETEQRLFAPERLLTDLDKSIDKYAQYRMGSGSVRSDTTAEKIAAFIREQTERNFDMLEHEADSVDYPRNRAIAVAALGFADEKRRDRALAILTSAARDENTEVVANAIFGLAILRSPATNPRVIARVIESKDVEDTVRAGAAWALYEIQQNVVDQSEIVSIWSGVLAGPIDAQPPAVTVGAVRGLGFARDPAHVDEVLRYVSHPIALVRTAAAIALGRMADAKAVPGLLTLIGPAETNDNVRLAARKALQALAGDVDRGYDVEEWKRVFDRGS